MNPENTQSRRQGYIEHHANPGDGKQIAAGQAREGRRAVTVTEYGLFFWEWW